MPILAMLNGSAESTRGKRRKSQVNLVFISSVNGRTDLANVVNSLQTERLLLDLYALIDEKSLSKSNNPAYFCSMKNVRTFLFVISLLCIHFVQAQDQSLKLQYSFNLKAGSDSILDETGNGYNGKLNGSAKIKSLGAYNVLQIGSTTGYLDLQSKLGNLVKTLSDFTVSTYLYIDPSLVLTNNGNFVWSFANSADIANSATGGMFYSAKASRYAIFTTNYTTEKQVTVNSASVKGEWTHITYTQSGTTGTVYVDGVSKKTGSLTLLPSALGATAFNYLAKSSYASDQYLLNCMFSDFRIYNTALNATQVATLATKTAVLDTLTYTDLANTAANSIALGSLTAVSANLTLPTTDANGAAITWSSSNTSVITNAGVVTRPALGANAVNVTLTASVTSGFVTIKKTFVATVVPYYNDATSAQLDADNLTLTGNLTNLVSNLTLPKAGLQGSTISWTSSNNTVMSNSGAILQRPAAGSGKISLTMTATVLKGTFSIQKSFAVFVAEEEDLTAYLFAYFTGNSGNQEAIRFATSSDGYIYTALNNNNPVLSSAAISSTGGIRDPHILRGEEVNTYYMVATDMVSAKGWDSNRAMVLLKSNNLTDWSSAVVNIPITYPEYAAADRVWAPQTIYDPSVGKYMVYFAMRLGASDYDKIYYAYANSTFTGLESAPKVLFNNNGLSTIDADIVFANGQYQLFFKTEGNGNGIKKAVSNSLTSGYVLYDKYLQSTTNAVEGGCVFKLIHSNTWILMYDMYTSGAYQFTKSTDLVNFSVVSNTVSFDFTPRHGTIIPITPTELNALNVKWNPSAVAVEKPTVRFSVYPVPAKDFLNVQFDGAYSKVRAEVYNLMGRMVLQQDLSANRNQVPLNGLTPGVYFIKCLQNNTVMGSSRFIVER